MIKAVCFDLDGTLVDLCSAHYWSLNKALREVCNYEISEDLHLKFYDGKTTNTKLKILENRGIVKEEQKKEIWNKKQMYTFEYIDTFKTDDMKVDCMKRLKGDSYKLVCVSNSIRETVNKILKVIGVLDYFNFILGNEDFKDKPKPNEYPYLLAFEMLGLSPDECLILEDNFNGIMSAKKSKGNLFEVKSVSDVNYENIRNKISEIDNA